MMRCNISFAVLSAAVGMGAGCTLHTGEEAKEELGTSQQASHGGPRGTEFQITREVFVQLLTRSLQQKVSDQCLTPVGDRYIDHVDVAPLPSKITLSPAGLNAIAIAAPLDVFVVERSALVAAPNGVPASVAVRATLHLALVLKNRVLTLEYKSLDLGPLESALESSQRTALETQIKSSLGKLASQDLKSLLDDFQSGADAENLVVTEENIAVGFGESPNVNRLSASQSWGAFFSGATVEQIAASALKRLDDVPLPGGATIIATPHWRPVGTLPRVDMDIRGKLIFPEPFAYGHADIIINARTDFSLENNGSALRSTIHWEIANTELHTDFPGFLEAGAEILIRETLIPYAQNRIKDVFDPGVLGATRIDDQTFYKDKPLNAFGFAGARFIHDSLLASPDGMTLGGPVALPQDPGTAVVNPTVDVFNGFDPLAVFACPAPAPAHRKASLDMVSASADIRFDAQAGAKVCGFEYVPNDEFLRSQTKVSDDSAGVSVRIPGTALASYEQPIQLILHTSRGVRFFNLGTPPKPVLDENGVVTNAVVQAIDTCTYVDPDYWNWQRRFGAIDLITTVPGIDDGPGIPPIPSDVGGVLRNPMNPRGRTSTVEGLDVRGFVLPSR